MKRLTVILAIAVPVAGAPTAPKTAEAAPAVQPAKLLSRPALQYPPLALAERFRNIDGLVSGSQFLKRVN
jgi:hypothetical protein